MIARSINISNSQEYVNYRHELTDDIDIVFRITYDIEWDTKNNKLKFKVNGSSVYLEKEMNKYHIQYKILSNKQLILDKFSLWLALDLWSPSIDKNMVSFLDDLELDKLMVSIH